MTDAEVEEAVALMREWSDLCWMFEHEPYNADDPSPRSRMLAVQRVEKMAEIRAYLRGGRRVGKMKLLAWQDWNGVPVSEAQRDAMAQEILRDRDRGLRTTSVHTGDTLIYLSGPDADGEGQILDCIVRRKARVTGTPRGGETA